MPKKRATEKKYTSPKDECFEKYNIVIEEIGKRKARLYSVKNDIRNNENKKFPNLKRYMNNQISFEIEWLNNKNAEANAIIDTIKNGVDPEKGYESLIEEADMLIRSNKFDSKNWQRLTKYNYNRILNYEDEYTSFTRNISNSNNNTVNNVLVWCGDNTYLTARNMFRLEKMATRFFEMLEESKDFQKTSESQGETSNSKDEFLLFRKNRMDNRIKVLLNRCNELSGINYDLSKHYLKNDKVLPKKFFERYSNFNSSVNKEIKLYEAPTLRVLNLENKFWDALLDPKNNTEEDIYNRNELCQSNDKEHDKGLRPVVGPVGSLGEGILLFAQVSSSVEPYFDRDGNKKPNLPVKIVYNTNGEPTAVIRLDKLIPVTDGAQLIPLNMTEHNRNDIYRASNDYYTKEKIFKLTEDVTNNREKYPYSLYFSRLALHSINDCEEKLASPKNNADKSLDKWFQTWCDTFDNHKNIIYKNIYAEQAGHIENKKEEFAERPVEKKIEEQVKRQNANPAEKINKNKEPKNLVVLTEGIPVANGTNSYMKSMTYIECGWGEKVKPYRMSSTIIKGAKHLLGINNNSWNKI